MRRLVLDTGPFLLLFTNEEGSETAKKTVVMHEKRQLEAFIHPNCLSEAYSVLTRIKKEKPDLVPRDLDPEQVVRSTYATLKVVQDERTTVNLGVLKSKYKGIPWGDLSSAALSMRLSDHERVPVVILVHDKHFKEITEAQSITISRLKP